MCLWAKQVWERVQHVWHAGDLCHVPAKNTKSKGKRHSYGTQLCASSPCSAGVHVPKRLHPLGKAVRVWIHS